MKKFILLFMVIVPQFAWSQLTPDEIYWQLRGRLVDRNLVVGESNDCDDINSGLSIPASEIHSTHGLVHWGDGTSFLGLYIGVLATEYKLLSNSGKDLTSVKNELKAAMLAYERLDKKAEDYGTTRRDCTPVNGFFIRDDIENYFINNNASFSRPQIPHPDGWGYHRATWPNCDPATDPLCCDPINDPNCDTWEVNTIINEQNLPQHFRDRWTSDWAKPGVDNNMSVDQVIWLYMGFNLVRKYMPGVAQGGYDFSGKAKLYTEKIYQYLDAHDFLIEHPYQLPPPALQPPPNFSVAYPEAFFDYWGVREAHYKISGIPNPSPLMENRERLGATIWYLMTLFPDLFLKGINVQAEINVLIGAYNQVLAGLGQPPISLVGQTWIYEILAHRRAYLQVTAALGDSWKWGLEGIHCHTTTLLWGYIEWYRYALQPGDIGNTLQNLGTILSNFNMPKELDLVFQYSSCIAPFPLPDLLWNKTGKILSKMANQNQYNSAHLALLLYRVLHNSSKNPNSAYLSNRINQIPCIGPNNFFNSSPPLYEQHWRNGDAWSSDAPNGPVDDNGNPVHHGYFNGLDFMLLKNLYHLYYNNAPSDFEDQRSVVIDHDYPYPDPNDPNVLIGNRLNPVIEKSYFGITVEGNVTIKYDPVADENGDVKFTSKYDNFIFSPGFKVEFGANFRTEVLNAYCDNAQYGLRPGAKNDSIKDPYKVVNPDSFSIVDLFPSISDTILSTPEYQDVLDQLEDHEYEELHEYIQLNDCSSQLKGAPSIEIPDILKIYPNPISNIIYIDFFEKENNGGEIKIEIINTKGISSLEIVEETNAGFNKFSRKINLIPGYYIVKIEFSDQIKFRNIIIE